MEEILKNKIILYIFQMHFCITMWNAYIATMNEKIVFSIGEDEFPVWEWVRLTIPNPRRQGIGFFVHPKQISYSP